MAGAGHQVSREGQGPITHTSHTRHLRMLLVFFGLANPALMPRTMLTARLGWRRFGASTPSMPSSLLCCARMNTSTLPLPISGDFCGSQSVKYFSLMSNATRPQTSLQTS